VASILSKAEISFIFMLFLIYWHSDIKGPCLNMTVDKQLYLKNIHELQVFCFLKYITYTKCELSTLILKRAVLMRYTETLSFGHGSHLSQHRLGD
jgi:hypothetical protein